MEIDLVVKHQIYTLRSKLIYMHALERFYTPNIQTLCEKKNKPRDYINQ